MSAGRIGAMVLGVVLAAGVSPGQRVAVRASEAPEAAAASGWIGVWLSDEVDGGARVVALVPDGPAERADLRVGDIILLANEAPVPVQAVLSRVLRDVGPGGELRLQILRDGATLALSVMLASRPERTKSPVVATFSPPPDARLAPPAPPVWLAASDDPRLAILGLDATEITPALREHYGAPADAGVLVVRSDPHRPGGQAGIQVGDVIVSIASVPVVHPRQLQVAALRLEAGGTLAAQVVRDGEPRLVQLSLREPEAVESGEIAARRAAEAEIVTRRLRLELERLEQRMDEIRRELARIERGKRD